MTNNENFEEVTNYSDVYLRNVIIGFLGFLKNRFKWKQTGEMGSEVFTLPIYYSLTGDTRYIMDAFYDDIPDKRVNMNTDSIPRGIITLKSWTVKSDEFTNPNIWLNVNMDIDNELKQIVTQTKAVPIKLTFTLDVMVDNEIEIFKLWESFMKSMWIYKYFTYSYSNLPINAVFNFIADTENTIIRDYKFGDLNVLKTSYNFDVHTFYPIFDIDNKFLANTGVQWIMQIWQQ